MRNAGGEAGADRWHEDPGRCPVAVCWLAELVTWLVPNKTRARDGEAVTGRPWLAMLERSEVP